MQYVIIGASAAGLACAESIRKADKKGSVTIITQEAYLPYSRPSISYYLKGKVNEGDMYLRRKNYYKEQNIEIITDSKVKSIDKAKKVVRVSHKEYKYDKLCLCTGSVPFVPQIKNTAGKLNAMTFLDLEAVKNIKSAACSATKAVVIGAGLIGMKAAEGLSKICKSVDVVELSERILPSILDEKSSRIVKRSLEQNGIVFHLGNTVTEAKCSGKMIKKVILSNGKILQCDLLVIAVGVRPSTELAEKAQLEINRGIVTDTATMQTSHSDIYAAGDCTVSTDMLDGSKKIIALWPNAVQQGTAAGAQMAGQSLTVNGTYSVNAIDFFSTRICTCGLINAKGGSYSDMVSSDGSKYKRLIFEGSRLVGYVLINCSENAGIYTSLIANKTDVGTLSGDILDTPCVFMFDQITRKEKLTGGMKL